VVLEASHAQIDALLAGKQKTELSALDKLKAHKRGPVESGVSIRGTAGVLRELARALRAPAPTSPPKTREIAAEASAPPLVKKRDRVRTADGRYIKGARRGAARAAPAPSLSSLAPAAVASTDRVAFALQNLRAFLEAGLARAADASDDVLLTLHPGEVLRG
jgi:hypothetical protein